MLLYFFINSQLLLFWLRLSKAKPRQASFVPYSASRRDCTELAERGMVFVVILCSLSVDLASSVRIMVDVFI